MADRSLLIQLTGDLPLFRIIDFLVDNKGRDYTKAEIASGAKISRATLFNHWHRIENHGLVRVTRTFGKTRLFTLDSQSMVVKRILDLEKALIRKAIQRKVLVKA